MKTHIILISGKMGTGKDFMATHMKQYLEENQGKKVGIFHFGDPLKLVATQLYGWTGKRGEGREIIQKVGTEIGRSHSNNKIWTDFVASVIGTFRGEFDVFIIPDARHKSELEDFNKYFGNSSYNLITIRLLGKSTNDLREDIGENKQTKQHNSETDLDNYNNFDFIYNNAEYSMYKLFGFISKVAERTEAENEFI